MAPPASCWYFYPRPPRGGRRVAAEVAAQQEMISIHALREEGDTPCCGISWRATDFYPRPPRGGRLLSMKDTSGVFYFYPRPPRGGRQLTDAGKNLYYRFLSTPSARRATPNGCKHRFPIMNFYPRPPRGGRPEAVPAPPAPLPYFYPRPPRGGRLDFLFRGRAGVCISIHALREEGDSKNRDKISIFL